MLRHVHQYTNKIILRALKPQAANDNYQDSWITDMAGNFQREDDK